MKRAKVEENKIKSGTDDTHECHQERNDFCDAGNCDHMYCEFWDEEARGNFIKLTLSSYALFLDIHIVAVDDDRHAVRPPPLSQPCPRTVSMPVSALSRAP